MIEENWNMTLQCDTIYVKYKNIQSNTLFADIYLIYIWCIYLYMIHQIQNNSCLSCFEITH